MFPLLCSLLNIITNNSLSQKKTCIFLWLELLFLFKTCSISLIHPLFFFCQLIQFSSLLSFCLCLLFQFDLFLFLHQKLYLPFSKQKLSFKKKIHYSFSNSVRPLSPGRRAFLRSQHLEGHVSHKHCSGSRCFCNIPHRWLYLESFCDMLLLILE